MVSALKEIEYYYDEFIANVSEVSKIQIFKFI